MINKSIKNIFFDFGGTLDLDGVHWYRHWRRSWAEAGADISDERFKNAYFFAEHTLNELVSVSCNYSDLIELKCRLQADNLFSGQISSAEFDPAVKEVATITFAPIKAQAEKSRRLLSALSEHYTLGVISNFYGNLRESLDELGLSEFMTYIIDSKKIGKRKPGTEIYDYSAKLSGRQPEECLMVGDSYMQDIVPAKKIGMVTAMLDTPQLGLKEKINYDNIDYIISSINELTNIFFIETEKKYEC